MQPRNNRPFGTDSEFTGRRPHDIMKEIHHACHHTAEEFGNPGNYIVGANIVGFVHVAEAMVAFGLI